MLGFLCGLAEGMEKYNEDNRDLKALIAARDAVNEYKQQCRLEESKRISAAYDAYRYGDKSDINNAVRKGYLK